MDNRSRYLPQLDGLRALACAVVVLHHIPMRFGVGGYIGVDVFFVLSGFLITRILRNEMHATNTINLREFYKRRLRRLTPALVLLCLFVAQIYLVVPVAPNKHETVVGALLTVTYAGSWAKAFGWASLGWLAHTWSLSVEEHFYLFWPILIRWARTSVDRLLSAVLVLMTASSLLWFVGVARGWPVDRIVFAPDTRAKDILFGCALALLLERGTLSKRPPVAVGGLGLGVLAAWSLVVTKDSALYLFGWPIVLVASASVVWVLVSDATSPLSRWLSHPTLVWTGKRSYSIYLWHYPLTIFNAAVVHWSAPGRVLVAALTTSTSVALAAWSYRFVERPLRDQAYGPVTISPLRAYVRRVSLRIGVVGRRPRPHSPARTRESATVVRTSHS